MAQHHLGICTPTPSHHLYGSLWACSRPSLSFTLCTCVPIQIYDKKSNIKIGKVLQYILNRTGPLATTGCDHGAFASTTGADFAVVKCLQIACL